MYIIETWVTIDCAIRKWKKPLPNNKKKGWSFSLVVWMSQTWTYKKVAVYLSFVVIKIIVQNEKKKCSDPSLQFWWVAGKKVQHSKNNMQMLGWCSEWWKKPHNISWTHQQQHRVGGQSSLSFQNKQIQFRIERTRIWLRIGNGKEKRIQILKIQCNTTTWYEKFEKKIIVK